MDKRQELTDKVINLILSVSYGERFIRLHNVEDDLELDRLWETLDNEIYTLLETLSLPDDKLQY